LVGKGPAGAGRPFFHKGGAGLRSHAFRPALPRPASSRRPAGIIPAPTGRKNIGVPCFHWRPQGPLRLSPAAIALLRDAAWSIIADHGQQTDRPHSSRNRTAPGNRWRHYWPLPQLRKSCRTDRWLAGIRRATGQGTGEAQGASGNRRPHGRALAGNREERGLRAAQEAAEEISGDDTGFAATPISWTEKSGL